MNVSTYFNVPIMHLLVHLTKSAQLEMVAVRIMPERAAPFVCIATQLGAENYDFNRNSPHFASGSHAGIILRASLYRPG